MPNRRLLFSTPVPTPVLEWCLNHRDGILMVGSCFTENIGGRLVASGFDCKVNPFGIQYNPLSMAECLRRCLTGEKVGEEHLVQHNGLWHSWLHHGSFSSADKNECLRRCNDAIDRTYHFLTEKCDTLMLTMGTAFVYELVEPTESVRVVSNCHKVPQRLFAKRLVGMDEIEAAWEPIWEMLKVLPREVRVLFTISPIRHWADGAHGNQLSKATLMLAVERMLGERRGYFPAYEIVMDELRDYRFYDEDMLHPSKMAEEVVWQRLKDALMDDSTAMLAEKYQQLERLRGHRPMFPESEEYGLYMKRIAALEQEILTLRK